MYELTVSVLSWTTQYLKVGLCVVFKAGARLNGCLRVSQYYTSQYDIRLQLLTGLAPTVTDAYSCFRACITIISTELGYVA